MTQSSPPVSRLAAYLGGTPPRFDVPRLLQAATFSRRIALLLVGAPQLPEALAAQLAAEHGFVTIDAAAAAAAVGCDAALSAVVRGLLGDFDAPRPLTAALRLSLRLQRTAASVAVVGTQDLPRATLEAEVAAAGFVPCVVSLPSAAAVVDALLSAVATAAFVPLPWTLPPSPLRPLLSFMPPPMPPPPMPPSTHTTPLLPACLPLPRPSTHKAVPSKGGRRARHRGDSRADSKGDSKVDSSSKDVTPL